MLKIATVNFGHVDSVLPLYKRFKNIEGIKFTHYFCFALNRKYESILDFSDLSLKTGFVNFFDSRKILKDELINYFNNDISNIKFYIFYNLKIYSLQNLRLSLLLSKELKQYDIIHFNGLNAVLPYLIFKLRKKSLIFTIHDVIPHSGEHSRFGFTEKLVNFLCNSNFPIIIHNNTDFNYCIQKYKSKKNEFYYIPFGIFETYKEFHPSAMPSSDILFFGRISKYKGLEYLINALKILKQQNIYLKTVIAGKGILDNNLLNEINESNYITLINRPISNYELSGLLNNTKVVICPYTDATQSGVLMTAFAFGKPVIATNVGGFKEIIIDGYNGLLVEPRNILQLSEAIKKALNDNFYKNLLFGVNDFINMSSKYNWNNILNEYISIYENCE